jgi:large subunit ribosomal protein L25
MADLLNVKARETTGKKNNKRLRASGMVPAVLYGHGEANVSLAVCSDEMASVLRHHARVVELKGAANEKALIRDLQWDTYGIEVLHVDLSRVSEHERVTVQVPIELRGDAPGIKEGGVVEVVVHEVDIECEALSIPEKLDVNVKELHLEGEITAGDVVLPAGVTMVTDAEVLLVHCVKPKAISDEPTAGAAGVAEPEVIGRKPGDEEAEEEK